VRLRETLYFDERTKTVPKTTIKNHIVEDIVRDGDLFMKNRELLDSLYKLKQLNLLKNHEFSL
jgi:AP-1 complex subunit beta-1